MGWTVRWWAVAALVAAACGGNEAAPIEPGAGLDPVQTVVGRSFTLRVGQEARVGQDFRLVFRSVASDSRCPVDVQCVWQGNARVQASANGATITLNTGEEPRSSRAAGYDIVLEKLEPAPRSDSEIREGSYEATFVVTRASQ